LEGLASFIKRVVSALEKEKLDYAFTGALAASFYGVPRTTTDIDIMVAISQENLKTKLASVLLLAGLDFEEKRIDDAITSGYKIATFKSRTSAYKVDIILADRVRKRDGNIAGVDTFLQVPEDLINAKLRMIHATIDQVRAGKDEDDVRAVVHFTDVDKKIIQKQARRDGTLEIWKRLAELD
jgi:hypothetical protein